MSDIQLFEWPAQHAGKYLCSRAQLTSTHLSRLLLQSVFLAGMYQQSLGMEGCMGSASVLGKPANKKQPGVQQVPGSV
jgi:hypothetical protein